MTRPASIAALAPIMQMAFVPTDFDGALRYWTETMGVGPFFLMENIQLGDMTYMGEPTDAVFSVAIAYWNDIQIELVRPDNDGLAHYSGQYGVRDALHHTCHVVEDIEVARRAVLDAGGTIVVSGKVGEDGHVFYADPGFGPGGLVEYIQLGAGGADFFRMMQDAAVDWNGSEPVRKLG